MGQLTIKGRPERLDAVIRPMAFVGLVGVGVIASAVLAWFQIWLWMPVPAVAAYLVWWGIFSLRADKPIVVTLVDGVLQADDPRGGHHFELDLSTVELAGLSVRQVDNSTRDLAYLVLHGPDGPTLALRLSTPRRAWPRHAADLDALQPLLGGNAGVLRGLAPQDRIIRQVLDDAEGTLAAALLRAVPEEAWRRRALRLWRGVSPPVDFMGLHTGPPDAVLILDPDGPSLELRPGPGPGAPEAARLPITATSGGRSSRVLTLLSLPGQDDRYARLPLLVWTLAEELHLAVPAPIGGHLGDEVELDEDTTWHTHLGEGAAAVWWLLEHLERVPDHVRQGLSDARVVQERLHPTLARHLPDEPEDAGADEAELS